MKNKRYSMKGSTILEDGEEITAWDCCDLLNELNDENKELKQQLTDIDKLVNDLGSREMCRQYDEIISDETE